MEIQHQAGSNSLKILLTEKVKNLPDNSTTKKVVLSSLGKKIAGASTGEIRQLISVAVVLLGINQKNVPQGEEMVIFCNFMQNNLGQYTLEEFGLAIEYAASKKINVDVSLYGGTLSASYMAAIIHAYNQLKAPIILKAESDGMTNKQQFCGIVDIMKQHPEGRKTLEKLKNIGKTGPILRPEKDQIKLPNEDKIQALMVEFNKLRKDQGGQRFAMVEGKILSIQEFLEYKLKTEL